MKRRATAVASLAVLLAVAFGSRVSASQLTATMEVSAVVVPNCRFTLSALNFGAYDPLGVHQTADLDATATVFLSCTRNSQASISMDAGRTPVPGTNLRGLSSADQLLRYQLYREASRREVWATGADALHFQATGENASRQEFTVYGRIPAAQEVAAGMYSDVVTATVHF